MVFRVAIIGLLLAVRIGTTVAAEPGVPQALTRKLAEFPGAERGKVIPVKDDVIARVSRISWCGGWRNKTFW